VDEIDQNPQPHGYQGSRFLNTFKGDQAKGTYSSPQFRIENDYIHLLVGGGNDTENLYVGLFINNERVRSETGVSGSDLTQRTWNVSDLKGQTAEIRVVDSSSGGWGCL
jgi:hypothetical protein